MKTLIITLNLVVATTFGFGQSSSEVKFIPGHYNSEGTFINGHYVGNLDYQYNSMDSFDPNPENNPDVHIEEIGINDFHKYTSPNCHSWQLRNNAGSKNSTSKNMVLINGTNKKMIVNNKDGNSPNPEIITAE